MSFFSTSPLTITDFHADAQHFGGHRRGYRFIVLHHTGGTDSKLWLSRTSPLSKPVSVQRLITKTGKNIKIADDDEVAWTQGFARIGPLPRKTPQGATIESVNDWALAIEFENLGDGKDPYPTPQLEMGAAQVVEWWGAYGFMALVAHAWIDENKNDPLGFPWDLFYSMIWMRLRAIAR
jgi:N-acetyl-anhydromuramyl-L-alanine amidase AmpD